MLISRFDRMSRISQGSRVVVALLLVSVGGCSRAPVPSTVPAVSRAVRPAGLPPVPAVRGAPLDVRVQYPDDNQILTSRDSNFVLGRVGSGDARLTINGAPVTVAPNGAFIAWLANPMAGAARYELVASRGADTARRTVRVRYPVRRPLTASGRLQVDSGSLAPMRGTWWPAAELLRVSVRAPGNATVLLETGGASVPVVTTLRPLAQLQASARLAVGGAASPLAPVPPVSATDAAATFATDVAASLLGDSASLARVLVIRDGDTVRLTVPVVRALPAASRTLAMLRSRSAAGSDTDKVIYAGTIADGTYKWMLLPGTMLSVTGRQNGFTRVRLDDVLDVWVNSADVQLLPEGSPLPRRVTGGFRVQPDADWADVVIGLGERPAHLVESEGRTVVLTLYGTQGNASISPMLGGDSLIRRINWEQVGSDRLKVTMTLSQPVFGWLSLWDESRRAFVLRLRRAPRIDPRKPLEGLVIAVDPGHPPAGATGPTGLYEGDAVFPVGQMVADMLRARGAMPVLTRTSLAPVDLGPRAAMARQANAHAFLSIHLNALPDGVNPFLANGTSTLFFHQPSEPLARAVQRAMMARFGLRDLGVHYQNLAVARPSWYPSMLAEGLFLMMPEQEAAMRQPAFQRVYAEAIVAGVEDYFRDLWR